MKIGDLVGGRLRSVAVNLGFFCRFLRGDAGYKMGRILDELKKTSDEVPEALPLNLVTRAYTDAEKTLRRCR